MGLPFSIGALKARGGEAGSRPQRLYLPYPWWRLTIGLVVLVVIGLVASGVGAVYVPPLTTAKILLSKLPLLGIDSSWPNSWETIIWQIRFPRVVLAGLVGGVLQSRAPPTRGSFGIPWPIRI